MGMFFVVVAFFSGRGYSLVNNIQVTRTNIEKRVDINFSLFLNNFDLLHKSQSGFRAKHSTASALILMVDSWLKAFNAGKLIDCVISI